MGRPPAARPGAIPAGRGGAACRDPRARRGYWSLDGSPLTCREVADHARLIAEADLGYPILLSSDGRVMDGMHRVARALTEGRRVIAARRFPHDPEPDHVGVRPEDLSY